ncbi:MAG: amidase [Alphaproteobacteria bacterium]|nr:amidase [Alphaproteobacteria bacterium]
MTPLHELAAGLQTGRTTSRSLVEDALAHIRDADGEGARVFLKIHDRAALAAADASDALRDAGVKQPPLAGLPISVKDLFDLAGDVTTAGSRLLRDAEPAAADAPAIARLRAAGAIVIGRTNMTEFAYSGLGMNPHYGTPANPWDRKTRRIPGGSSSGAAVSVTDGMAAAAIGSDTGGSVRIPAALCGLTGFKPTAQRIPTEGAWPLAHSLDSVGPLAPTVSCCALLDAAMAGASVEAPSALPLKGLRLAVPRTLVFEHLDDVVAQRFQAAAFRLATAGAQISDITFAPLGRIPEINAGGGIYAEAWAVHRRQIEAHEAEYDPRVATRIRRASGLSAADYYDVLRAREALIREADAVTAPFDAVILPTTAIVAPPIAALEADENFYTAANILMLRNTFCFNFLDRCALSIPMHEPGGAPCGLMVVGETMGDARLLAIGRAVEAALRE